MIDDFIVMGVFMAVGFFICKGVDWVRRKFNG